VRKGEERRERVSEGWERNKTRKGEDRKERERTVERREG
jgi:hypothetical protein